MILKAELVEGPAALPRRRRGLMLTGPTRLIESFREQVRAPLGTVAAHPYFARFGEHATPAQMKKALLGFYPLIEQFPQYMAAMLARIDGGSNARAEEARSWLMKNISVEERHREWWLDWGAPLGLSEADFVAHRPTARMEAHTHFLYYVARARPIGEAFAAVNYAVEGATGIWAREMCQSFRKRLSALGLADVGGRAARWLDAHAEYDDAHPVEALELVKVFCPDARSMDLAAQAAVRSLEYYTLALDDACDA